jgi:sulfate permease, SulP family
MKSIFPRAQLVKDNWKSGLTVAFISVPLSIALSIASGAGPIPGLVTGVWATLIASCFGSSNYNVVGAAGALTTVLFAATLAAPLGLGAAVLPLLAMMAGGIILVIWFFSLDRFLYYIPSSVMYGFATGVAFLIASSQLFDAAGLSTLKRTGTFFGDVQLFAGHATEVQGPTLMVFAFFLLGILIWKRWVKALPAVIPAAVVGILFGVFESSVFPLELLSLGEKFGSIQGTLMASVPWALVPALVMDLGAVISLGKIAAVIALIAVLETLITAKMGDRLTKTQSSSARELLGLALANIGSGVMGGLPATGVFIRAGANIKAGATHRTSATIAAVVTGLVALVVLPFFTYIPMAVIAAILVNTAIGLIEVEKFKEFWQHERRSFVIALIVTVITVVEDASVGVLVGSLLALLSFADSVSHGHFDVTYNFTDGTKATERDKTILKIPHDVSIEALTYSIAGQLGYIDSARHAANLRHAAHAKNVRAVIVRLRDLFAVDYEGVEMLNEAIAEFRAEHKKVYLSSASRALLDELETVPMIRELKREGAVTSKTAEALDLLHIRRTSTSA